MEETEKRMQSVYWMLKDRYPTIFNKLLDIYTEKTKRRSLFRIRAKNKAKQMPDATVYIPAKVKVGNTMLYIAKVRNRFGKYFLRIQTKKLQHRKWFNDYEEAKTYRDEYIKNHKITGLKFPQGEHSYIVIVDYRPTHCVRIPVVLPDGQKTFFNKYANSESEAIKIRNNFMLSHKVIYKGTPILETGWDWNREVPSICS